MQTIDLEEQSKQNIQMKHYDGTSVANQFIEYFYQAWTNNPDTLNEVIKPYSKLKYKSTLYEGLNFIELLKTFISEGLRFENCNYEIVDSGSRQIYILVNGEIKNNLVSKIFSQSFMIAYAGEYNKKCTRKWTLMNSLLIIN
jgi:hypothetical protein